MAFSRSKSFDLNIFNKNKHQIYLKTCLFEYSISFEDYKLNKEASKQDFELVLFNDCKIINIWCPLAPNYYLFSELT